MTGLDDPHYARFAWRRFRRILAATTAAGVVAAGVAIVLVGRAYGPLGWVAVLALFGGVVGSVAMAGALMGLAFMSSGTGHDEAVDAFTPDRDGR
ncbi:hypothetical protein [Sphingomonas corticis]|jgi:peptidoglycan/LPS O-acetylase OafA/YrhL|uniref:Uncharacterized protein n=1 Tax=Sphingomonas corticis TaxID=2722791 RepID=A0ABX1CPG7_9SPHN|nr:hypothetical protein [Sphingomonas corticis]NJR79789.1 hypothetical protein [Sphingomonas corticis]